MPQSRRIDTDIRDAVKGLPLAPWNVVGDGYEADAHLEGTACSDCCPCSDCAYFRSYRVRVAHNLPEPKKGDR